MPCSHLRGICLVSCRTGTRLSLSYAYYNNNKQQRRKICFEEIIPEQGESCEFVTKSLNVQRICNVFASFCFFNGNSIFCLRKSKPGFMGDSQKQFIWRRRPINHECLCSMHLHSSTWNIAKTILLDWLHEQ